MSDTHFLEFESRSVLDEMMAEAVTAVLQQAIATRGKASLVVSGGSTPKGFFQAMAHKAIDWSKLTITLADDRWVPPSHEDSNDRLVQENLLQGPAAAANFIPLVTEDAHPRDAVESVSERLADLGTVDVMILGMGGDGHFASLFPDSETLKPGLDLNSGNTLIAVDPPVAPHARMSMTLPRIFDTRHLLVHLVGDEKRAIWEKASAERDPERLPIAAVIASESPRADVYWAP
ncbi:6-phosphogluconolactonase [Congregibacter variabilis]|uniref:6-phosphogluconolactonase n=1 Tax=Congregibacter variabilis TaxID=3081200 RepID=A0ABZ0I7K4_9GAMM|nr:6-phosphogluconolactonase [Congregibacter sp. IMCC43200]